jgi:hypothetical protein
MDNTTVMKRIQGVESFLHVTTEEFCQATRICPTFNIILQGIQVAMFQPLQNKTANRFPVLIRIGNGKTTGTIFEKSNWLDHVFIIRFSVPVPRDDCGISKEQPIVQSNG